MIRNHEFIAENFIEIVMDRIGDWVNTFDKFQPDRKYMKLVKVQFFPNAFGSALVYYDYKEFKDYYLVVSFRKDQPILTNAYQKHAGKDDLILEDWNGWDALDRGRRLTTAAAN